MSTKELIDQQMREFEARLDADYPSIATSNELEVEPTAPEPETRRCNDAPLIGFPEIYRTQGPPTGERWLAEFSKAMALVESGGLVIFHGTRGTGKSRMAYEVARTAKLPKPLFPGQAGTSFRKSRPAIYSTAMMIFLKLRGAMRKNSEKSELEIVEDFAGAALLVIDEVQERGDSPFEDRTLTSIVDLRYSAGRPTIIIGNLSRKEFSETLSPSIMDRIRENGGGIDFNWSSYRALPECHVKREPIKPGGIWK